MSIDRLNGYRAAMNEAPWDSRNAALLVVDLQNGGCHPDGGWPRAYQAAGHGQVIAEFLQRLDAVVVPQVSGLIASFRAAGATVAYSVVGSLSGDYADLTPRFARSRAYWHGLGIAPPYAAAGTWAMKVIDPLAPADGDIVVAKTGYSAFVDTPLPPLLIARGVRQIAVCGVSTEMCVESTLRSAVDLGYDCALVEDGSGAVAPDNHARAVAAMSSFAQVMPAAEVAARLLEKAVAL